MNDDHHCDMCAHYEMNAEYCTRYREAHYPTDGQGCIGWEYWDDPTFRHLENKDTRPMEGG